MNKIKLFALAVMAMLSTNAFALAPTYVSKSGHIYKYTGAIDEKTNTVDGTFAGVGNEKTTVSIPATVVISDPKTEKSYTVRVTGVEDNWWTENAESGAVTVTDKVTTLDINITNFSVALAEGAFSGLTKLATLTIKDETVPTKEKPAVTTVLPEIPNTVATLNFENTNIEKLGTATFTGETLTSVKLSKALTQIEKNAFTGCTKLAGIIKIPATVTLIGKEAFAGDVLADFDFSEAAALKTIYSNAFAGSGITKLALGKSVNLVEIYANAFEGCEKLTSLVLGGLKDGEKFTTIGASAFAGTAITAANLPASVTKLGESAFEGCEKLTALSAMAGLTAIPANAFKDCKALTKVIISENVAEIGANAFEGCEKLATVTIKCEDPEAPVLATIGYLAFKDCKDLASIDLSQTAIKEINGLANAQFLGCTALKEVLLPATVEKIGAQAFGDCLIENLDLSKTGIKTLNAIFRYSDGTYPTAKKPYASLKSIKLPEGLTQIQNYSGLKAGVFQYCTKLTEVTIPEGVTVVPSYAFQYSGLVTVTMSDGDVADKAFWYCDKLKTFNYNDADPSDGTSVSNDAFLGCTPFINFVTTSSYQKANDPAPTNAKYGTSANAKMKTVADKGTSGKAFGIFENTTTFDVVVEKSDDIKLYSIYVDEGTAYFQALRTYGGKYIIAPNAHIILKSDAPKEDIEFTTETASGKNSVLADDVITLNYAAPLSTQITTDPTYALADFQSDYVAAGEYVYRLTNNAASGGFGFTFFTGTEMKAGQFFIISEKKPAGAARLQTVWLDEDGNVESDATAIQQVEAASENAGEIYNLQGIRVNAAKKGLYIQNGKKFIVK